MATICPLERVPLYTFPKPPTPIASEKLFVHFTTSSNVKHFVPCSWGTAPLLLDLSHDAKGSIFLTAS
nr:hypothetical protein Iba_chr01aCG8670 [Ipomoea batatas]